VADKIMLRVAAGGNLHMMFYRDIVAADRAGRDQLAASAKTDRLASRFEAKRAASATGNEHCAAG
jgi:hypothetical protein